MGKILIQSLICSKGILKKCESDEWNMSRRANMASACIHMKESKIKFVGKAKGCTYIWK
jgi:hypothetical protein